MSANAANLSEHTKSDKLIESSTRLSHSKIWELQRNYFKTMGIEAWDKDIPYLVSNNPLIGRKYAYLVYQTILDIFPKNPNIIIAELGCGTGKFGYYFLKYLTEYISSDPSLRTFNLQYIMTDLSEKNIEFCQGNPNLKEYIEKRVLDFSIFDVESDSDIKFINRNQSFSDLKDPYLIMIANYTFDCIKHDILNFDKDQYKALQIGLTSRYKNFDTVNVKYLKELFFDYQEASIDLKEFCDNAALEKILNEYKSDLYNKNALMPIPVGALSFIDRMKKLTHNQLFLIVGDKGMADFKGFSKINENYRFTYEGCYAFLLNFYLIADYVTRLGGDALLTQKHNDFQVCVYSLGRPFNQLPKARFAFDEHFEHMGPQEYGALYEQVYLTGYRFSAVAISAFLRLSEWDPEAYALVHERLIELIRNLPPHERMDLESDLIKIEQNIYQLPIGNDIFRLLAEMYEIMGQENKAVELYQQSLGIFKTSKVSYARLASIYDKRKEANKALGYYKHAVELDPKNTYAKQRLLQLEGKMGQAMLRPLFRLGIVIAAIAAAIYLMTK